MPNQRKKGAKALTYFDWEQNVEKLRAIAKRKGVTLSELLRERTKNLLEEYGENYKEYDEQD